MEGRKLKFSVKTVWQHLSCFKFICFYSKLIHLIIIFPFTIIYLLFGISESYITYLFVKIVYINYVLDFHKKKKKNQG
jgi:hypothetical protein